MPFFFPPAEPVCDTPPSTPLARMCGDLESRFGWVARCVVWALVFQLMCLSYLPSLRGPFLYDDIEAIAGNPDLRAPHEPWRIFRDHETSLHFDKRPVAGFVTLVDFQLWGLHARGYRMTNLLLHFTCGLSIAALASAVARRMGSRYPLLFGHLLALLWLLHPLATSTVSFIFQRSEMLMSLFFVLSLYCLLRSETSRRSVQWLTLSLAAAFLSALSKETGLTIIMAIPLFARVCLYPSWKDFLRQRAVYLGVLLAGTVAIAIWVRTGVRFAELDQHHMELSGSWAYFKSQGPVIANYLRQVVFPHPLSFLPRYHPVPDFLGFLPYLVGLGGLAIILLAKGRKAPWIWLSMGGFLIILAPTSSFVPIPLEPEAEFRMYLPLAFVLAGLLAWIGRMILDTRLKPIAVQAILGSVVIAGIATSMTRNRVYSSARLLWEDCVLKAPANGKSWINLGFCYLELGEHDLARACAERLLLWGTRQNSPALLTGGNHLLATVLLQKGSAADALAIFEDLARDNPHTPGIRIGMIHALAASGSPAKALKMLQAEYPDPSACHPVVTQLYGGIYRKLGMREQEKDMVAYLQDSGLDLKILEIRDQSVLTRTGEATDNGISGGVDSDDPSPVIEE